MRFLARICQLGREQAREEPIGDDFKLIPDAPSRVGVLCSEQKALLKGEAAFLLRWHVGASSSSHSGSAVALGVSSVSSFVAGTGIAIWVFLLLATAGSMKVVPWLSGLLMAFLVASTPCMLHIRPNRHLNAKRAFVCGLEGHRWPKVTSKDAVFICTRFGRVWQGGEGVGSTNTIVCANDDVWTIGLTFAIVPVSLPFHRGDILEVQPFHALNELMTSCAGK